MKKNLLMFFVFFFSLFFIVGYSDIALADSDDDSDGDDDNDDDSDGEDDSDVGSGGGYGVVSGDIHLDSDDDDDNDDDDNDDNDNDDNDNDDDDNDDDLKDKIKGKSKLEVKSKKISFDEFGNKITLLTETKTRDGKVETITKRKIQSPDGVEITFKTKTKVEDGKERITNTVEINGAEVSTKLSVREEIQDDRTILKTELSTGVEQNIIVLPDVAAQIAIDEIQSINNFKLELSEIVDGD